VKGWYKNKVVNEYNSNPPIHLYEERNEIIIREGGLLLSI